MSKHNSEVKKLAEPKSFKEDMETYWKRQGKDYIQEMFDCDCKHFKIINVLQKKDYTVFLKNFKQNHYEKLLPIFHELQCQSLVWPFVSWHQIFEMFKGMNFFTSSFTLGSIDLIFRESTVPEEIQESRAEGASPQGMLRYQFMEMIMRVALERYWLTLEANSPEASLDMLYSVFGKRFRINLERNGNEYRIKKLLGNKEILEVIEERYDDLCLTFNFLKSKSNYVTEDRLINWLYRSDLVFNDQEVWRAISCSKLPILDELSEKQAGSLV